METISRRVGFGIVIQFGTKSFNSTTWNVLHSLLNIERAQSLQILDGLCSRGRPGAPLIAERFLGEALPKPYPS